jgi:hypothetical protein
MGKHVEMGTSDPSRGDPSRALHLVQEADCVRIVSSVRSALLQRLPSALERIRKIGSTEPAALLHDAAEAFDAGDARADDNIRDVQQSRALPGAVEACCRAAACEFRRADQMQLLRAAAYGKGFCGDADAMRLADAFVESSKKVRVLNALRDADGVAMPLTSAQYDVLAPRALVERLLGRHEHLFALKLCDYLRLPRGPVLVHWASAKVRLSPRTPDDELCRQVRAKLGAGGGGSGGETRGSETSGGGGSGSSRAGPPPGSGITKFPHSEERPPSGVRAASRAGFAGDASYARVAAVADRAGRRALATMLLEHEPRASNQVPMLLSMKEDALALDKATRSGDADLIYLALLHVKRAVAEEGRDVKAFFDLVQGARERAAAEIRNSTRGNNLGPPAAGARGSHVVGPASLLSGGGIAGLEFLGAAALSGGAARACAPHQTGRPDPADLLGAYCRLQDPALLKQMLFHRRRFEDGGMLAIREAYGARTVEERLRGMKVASGMLYSGHREGGARKAELGFAWRATEAQIKLLAMQRDLEAATGESYFVDMSVCETIYNCIVLSRHGKAAAIKNAFQVPDKRFWRLKVKALAECGDWKTLQQFANERRPPIGFRPFAEACIRKGVHSEAAKYILRIKDDAARLELFTEIRFWTEAGEVCVKMRDERALMDLGAKCEAAGDGQAARRLQIMAERTFGTGR